MHVTLTYSSIHMHAHAYTSVHITYIITVVIMSLLLHFVVPTPDITLSRTPEITSPSVGQELTWHCDVEVPGGQLTDVEIDIDLRGPTGILTSNGRIVVRSLTVVNPGQEYRRSVMFSSLLSLIHI